MSRIITRRKRYSRRFRKMEVEDILYYWGKHDGLTMTQLAFWMHIRPSTHLLGILKEMQGEGLLKSVKEQWRPNSVRSLWSLTSHSEQLAKRRIGGSGAAK